MNDFPLPLQQMGLGKTSSHFARPKRSQNRAIGLTYGSARRWVSALTLGLLGSTVAKADIPPVPDAAAANSAQALRLPKELNMELVPSCRRRDKPALTCTLEGDFDGDEKSDLAVLVQAKGCCGGSGACRQVGIVFLLGNGRHEVLGAGRGHWRHVAESTGHLGPARPLAAGDFTVESADAWSWRVWRLTPEGLRPLTGHGPHPSGRPPGMRRDAIELSGGDAAILIYRTAQGWIKYDLGY